MYINIDKDKNLIYNLPCKKAFALYVTCLCSRDNSYFSYLYSYLNYDYNCNCNYPYSYDCVYSCYSF